MKSSISPKSVSNEPRTRRLALEGELQRRQFSSSDIDSYAVERMAFEKSERLRRSARPYIANVGLGKKFLGKTNRRRDPSGNFEHYDTTLWFPIFPISTCTVRRDPDAGGLASSRSNEIPLERHQRNWEQIRLTKADLVLGARGFAFRLHSRHPEWLRHLP